MQTVLILGAGFGGLELATRLSDSRTLADVIGARVRGGSAERFRGQGPCYIEFGGGQVGKVDVDFPSGPAPRAPFAAPSPALAAEKAQFAADRRARWFAASCGTSPAPVG